MRETLGGGYPGSVVFFQSWPRDDDDAMRARDVLVTVPRVSTREEISVALRRIEDDLGKIAHAAIWPLAPASRAESHSCETP